MATTIAILLFEGAEEMDFAGPWEVLGAAIEGIAGERVLTVAERAAPVVCEKGMRVIPECSYGSAPAIDVLLVPGGSGARREISNPATVGWLRATAARCSWVTSVCTGAFLLVGAGLARGRRVTTHHRYLGATAGAGRRGGGRRRPVRARRQPGDRRRRHVWDRDGALTGPAALRARRDHTSQGLHRLRPSAPGARRGGLSAGARRAGQGVKMPRAHFGFLVRSAAA